MIRLDKQVHTVDSVRARYGQSYRGIATTVRPVIPLYEFLGYVWQLGNKINFEIAGSKSFHRNVRVNK